MKTDHVDNLLATIPSVCIDLPVLLRLCTAVMATKSRHVSEVSNSMLLLRRRADPFLPLDLYNAKHLQNHYTQDETLKCNCDTLVVIQYNGD